MSRDELNIAIGKALKQARKTKKITQEQLAEMIGVERSVLTRYETGAIEISMKNFVKICDALGLIYADVLSNIERM